MPVSTKALEALSRLGAWKLRRAAIASLLPAAWPYRHADALYVALAEHLQADFLTDDHNLVQSPTFPATVRVLRLSGRL
jgi:predicted nucleic acid-binding protein